MRLYGLVFLPIAALVSAILVPPHSVYADSAHGRGHGKAKHHGRSNAAEDTAIAINALISAGDRSVLRDYLHTNFMRNCPPGLAKKHNGCLPPGQTKKYRMGVPLGDVGYDDLPGGLLSRLHPPYGYRYVKVDTDVLLISEATKKVVDAVTLLSAVQ